jgi:hypothetical protein
VSGGAETKERTRDAALTTMLDDSAPHLFAARPEGKANIPSFIIPLLRSIYYILCSII